MQRFWEKVDQSGSCWLWTGARRGTGYGCFKVGGRVVSSHRFAFQLSKGEIPPGLKVLHRCDTPLCCRPDHLFVGTNSDNMKDRAQKGRQPATSQRGECHHSAQLTSNAVLAIRQSADSNRALARRFEVSDRAIRKVRSGETWQMTLAFGAARG